MTSGESRPRLAIFDTFKTKESLTSEAIRQRTIISILSSGGNATKRTRTGIAQTIAKERDATWKNIYSSVFLDLDRVLIPMGLVEEQGRLPLKRGPKALQEKGIPYYHLTRKGVLVALGTGQAAGQEALLDEFFKTADPSEKKFEMAITAMQKSSPKFTHSLLQKYVRAFCDGSISELLPFVLSKLRGIPDESLLIQREVLGAFMKMPRQDKQGIIKMLDEITPKE